jgi:hypothetical protein
MSLHKYKFDDYVDLIYSIELEIKYTTDITRSTFVITTNVTHPCSSTAGRYIHKYSI